MHDMELSVIFPYCSHEYLNLSCNGLNYKRICNYYVCRSTNNEERYKAKTTEDFRYQNFYFESQIL